MFSLKQKNSLMFSIKRKKKKGKTPSNKHQCANSPSFNLVPQHCYHFAPAPFLKHTTLTQILVRYISRCTRGMSNSFMKMI